MAKSRYNPDDKIWKQQQIIERLTEENKKLRAIFEDLYMQAHGKIEPEKLEAARIALGLPFYIQVDKQGS